jgi:putative membrane protein
MAEAVSDSSHSEERTRKLLGSPTSKESAVRTTPLIIVVLAFAASGCVKDPKDQDFVTKAGQGGLAEVQMGQLAATKGVAEDVKTFGQRMVSDHSKANEELKAIAMRVGATVPSDISSDQRDAMDKLQKESGADFDKSYGKAMVDDHKEDVDLFKKEASSGQNADLKAFAQKTLPTLEEHLRMAQALSPNK